MKKLFNRIKNIFQFSKQDEFIQDEIALIEDFFKATKVTDFVKSYNQLISTHNSKQYFTYIGVNFNEEKVHSVKFYAHFFEQLSNEEVLKFIPTLKDYSKFIHLKKDTNIIDFKEAGIALELKFNVQDKSQGVGFFFHLDPSKCSDNILPFPKELSSEFKQQYDASGVNYEYYDGKTKFKAYYYFSEQHHRTYLKNLFPKLQTDNSPFLEYAFTENTSKLNAYFLDEDFMKTKGSIFSNKEKAIIQAINKKYGLVNHGFGMYSNKPMKSIYFIDNTEIGSHSNNIRTVEKVNTAK